MNSTMSQAGLRKRRRLLDAWDYQCVICGHRFTNLACVTFEHVVPQSFSARKKKLMGPENVAPSHYRCNRLRGTRSIMVAAKTIADRATRMHPVAFIAWLNVVVPSRAVPEEALRPLHQPACLELPEHLPSYLRGGHNES